MAYVNSRENASGMWSHRVKYRVGGKERVQTFADLDSAERWCAAVNAVGHEHALKLLDVPAAGEPAGPTIAEIVAIHIESLSGIEPGTREDYRRHAARDITPRLGHIPAKDLTRRDVAEWINALHDGTGRASTKPLSAKTILNRHSLLSGAMASAVEHGTLPVNPCKGVRLPRGMPGEMVFLEPAEFRLILDRIPAYWQPLITLLAGTGLRWGEATALRVQDIDLNANRLRVAQAWKHNRGAPLPLGLPKSSAGARTVEYGPQVADILKARTDGRSGHALVFVNRQGRPVLNNSFHSRVWRPAVKAAMTEQDSSKRLAKEPRIHDLRHSYASWCLNAGVPLFVLSRVMGHESAVMTADRYGHLQPDRLSLAAAAAETALNLG